ncbi:MAG: hypothetical protein J2P48_07615 [Alphaproteobacteria bacterium]|nr:hypothetical protein [Alphaproteobacteria bacterium]
MKVRVYRNLTKNCYSVQSYVPGPKGRKRWKLREELPHVRSIMLKDAKFIVEAGRRRRVLTERKKNVHAFVEGYETDRVYPAVDPTKMRDANYNPYKAGHFYDKDSGMPLSTAKAVYLGPDGMTYG